MVTTLAERWGKGTNPHTLLKDKKHSLQNSTRDCDTLDCGVPSPQNAEAFQVSGKASKAWLRRLETSPQEPLASKTL